MGSVKKIIVFGPTGMTGIGMMRRALEEGMEVTAYARRPSRVPKDLRDKVNIIEGNVLDKQAVENAIEGHDAVLSGLGTGMSLGSTTLISDGCKNIIAGIKKHGIRKLEVISIATLLPGMYPGRFSIYLKVTEDHERQIDAMNAEKESIDWIAMMAPRIHNKTKINPEYSAEVNALPGDGDVVTVAELADFMVTTLNNEGKFKQFSHKKTGITSKPKTPGCFC